MPLFLSVVVLLAALGQVLGFLLGPTVLVARDACLALAVLFCLTRIQDRAFLLAAASALGLLAMLVVADMAFRDGPIGGAIGPIRNVFSLIAIPVIAACVPEDLEIQRWQRFSSLVLHVAFWSFCAAVFAELLVAMIFPVVHLLVDAMARAFLESKGVLANVEAGILDLPRMRTLILSPVQGAWFVLMLWIALPRRGWIAGVALVFVLALTVSKVAWLGLLAWGFVRARSWTLRSAFVMLGVGLSVAVFLLLSAGAEGVEKHLESGLLHLEGLASGLTYGLRHPFGAGFGSVGLAAAIGIGEVTPGMESFIGSTVAALGWVGLVVVALSAILFVGGSKLSRELFVVVLVGTLVSDNVASLFLYAPLLLRPYALGVTGERLQDRLIMARRRQPRPSLPVALVAR